MREGVEWSTITDLRFQNKRHEALKDIATLLRQGYDDPVFLDGLAKMINPDHSAGFMGMKFVLKQKRIGPPKKARDLDLEYFLLVQIEFFGAKQEAVFAYLKETRGISKTVAKEHLARAKADKDAQELAEQCKLAFSLCEKGDPEHQPIFGQIFRKLSDPT